MQITTKQKVSYGIGAVGKDMVYMLVSSYLLYYYNTVLGLSATFIGVVLMAARIFDAFNDPFMGIIVAKTKGRWGKFRPWIFSGTVLNAVVLFALFAVPQNAGAGMMKVYLTVLYFAWGITYTLMDIPFWSMIPAITEVGKDRENLSALARSCAGVGSAIPTVLTMLIVPILGGGAAALNLQIGFKWWALMIAVFFVISETICVLNIKEHTVAASETHGVGTMFKALFANDQAVTVVITIILVNTALYITSNLVIYYFTYDIGNVTAYSIFSAFGGAAQILAMMFFPLFRKKFSKKNLFVVAVACEIVGYGLLFILAFTSLTKGAGWMLLFVPGFLVFMGSGLLNVLITIFLSDSIDYGELKNGSRDESVIFSMQTFVVKLASGIAVLIAGASVDLVGLNVNTGTDQTGAALNGLRCIMTIFPTILLIVALLFFLRKYILDDKKMQEIVAALREKKA